MGSGHEGRSIERSDLLAQHRLDERARVQVDANPDVAGERRNEVLLQIEPGGLLDAVSQPRGVGAGGAAQLAPERLGRGRDAQVCSGVAR